MIILIFRDFQIIHIQKLRIDFLNKLIVSEDLGNKSNKKADTFVGYTGRVYSKSLGSSKNNYLLPL